MKSMTGYGWGECAEDGFKITVELSSVNRKQSEISINLPRELEVLEAQIRDEINRAVARGRLSARVSLHSGEGKEGARIHLNRKLAIAYTRELNHLAKELKLIGSVSLDLLLRAPGVLQTNEELADYAGQNANPRRGAFAQGALPSNRPAEESGDESAQAGAAGATTLSRAIDRARKGRRARWHGY
jgi:uncharacterized protein (TIGR00255 family)